MQKLKATIMDKSGIDRALKRIAHEILEKNQGCSNLCLVGIYRRGVTIARLLAKHIREFEGTDVNIGVLDISLYRDDVSILSDSGPVVNSTDIPFSITNLHVVLVDDVLYTGRTARAAIDAIISLGRPATIQLAVLIDRGHRELPIRGDYIGKNIPTSRSEFVAVKVPEYDNDLSVELYTLSQDNWLNNHH